MKNLTQDRWEQIDTLFKKLLDLPSKTRNTFLQEACGADTELMNYVKKLLRLHDEAEVIIGDTANIAAAPLIPGLLHKIENPDSEAPGTIIGNYEIIAEIGRGGMGTVYLAKKTGDPYGVQAAVKLLRKGMDTEDILRRFRHEGQILASLEHPNIARLYDGGIHTDGRPWFVMEYIKGEPIDLYCDKHALSVKKRLTLFKEVCEAVHYAHQKLIVHRDLKPAHVLVTEDGKIKLVDFGIAKLLEPGLFHATDFHTRTGIKVMTPEFAAPEQIRGEPVTTASDIYSLGVLLYLLLTGRRPYRLETSSMLEIERIVCETDPPRPSMAAAGSPIPNSKHNGKIPLNPHTIARMRGKKDANSLTRELSGDLDQIVLMALRKEPQRRYRSALELAEDLNHYLHAEPVQARPSTLRYRTRKFVHRNKLGVVAAAAIVLSLIGGLGMALWQAHQTQIAAERATNIKDQLIELFINPDEPQGVIANSRGLLDHGVARLRELPPGDPLREDLAGVLLGLYNQLMLTEDAERLGDAELGGAPVEPEQAATADLRLLTEWATAKWVQGRDLNSVWQTLVIATKNTRGESMLLADALVAQARIGMAAGHYQDAETAARQAISFLEVRSPANDRRLVSARLELAAALVGQRKNAQGYAETEHLIAEVPQGDTRLRQRVLIMAALRRALFGQFAAAEELYTEYDSIKIRRDSTEIWSFDELSHAINAFDLGLLTKSETILASIDPAQVNDNRIAEIHWLHGELALHRGEYENAVKWFEVAQQKESKTHLKAYYTALYAIALDRTGNKGAAHAVITSVKRMTTGSINTQNVAMALLEAADAAIAGMQTGKMDRMDGFTRALTILASAKEYPAVLEDQLKENRETVRILLWKAHAEIEAGIVNRAQATIAEALAIGQTTLGEQHPFVQELEYLLVESFSR